MGRLCGGAHEISGIKAPFFLHGGVGVVGYGVGSGVGVVDKVVVIWVGFGMHGVMVRDVVGGGMGDGGEEGGLWCGWCAGKF